MEQRPASTRLETLHQAEHFVWLEQWTGQAAWQLHPADPGRHRSWEAHNSQQSLDHYLFSTSKISNNMHIYNVEHSEYQGYVEHIILKSSC